VNKTPLCEHASVLGTQLSLCDQASLLTIIENAVKSGGQLTILSGNIHSFNLAYKTPWLQRFFNQADIVRLDGAGLSLGARILGYRTPLRMTWADFGWALAGMAAEHNFSLYLLGSKAGIAEKAAVALQEKHPNLLIAGTHHGYFDKTPGSEENKAVLEKIAQSKPDILIVGFGMPLQEQWLSQVRGSLAANVVMTGGAVFDYISGELVRAPAWMTNNGLEWLGRMLIEPRRLWKRYIIGNPLFFWRLFITQLGFKKPSN